MKISDQIRTTKFYVLKIDLSEPEIFLTTGLAFLKIKEKIDLDFELVAQPLYDILAQIPKNTNVIALFSGDDVLTRYSPEDRSTLFEEIEEEDFYFQKTFSTSGWVVQSACRRSIIDPIAGIFASRKLFLMDISFSPAVIPVLEEHIENVVLTIGHYRFEFKEQGLNSIEKVFSEEDDSEHHHEHFVAGMSFSPDGLAQLASVLHFFKEGPAKLEILRENNTQSKFLRMFRRASVLVLSGFFVVLLTNFLLFNSVQQNLNLLKTSGENLTGKISEIERLKAQISEYRDLVVYKTNSPEKTYSFYLDEIARIRPSGVWFNNLDVHPISRKQETNKAMEIDHLLVSLSGEAKDPLSVNRLIKSLEEMPWVRDIELKNYESSPESPNAEFEIAIRKEE